MQLEIYMTVLKPNFRNWLAEIIELIKKLKSATVAWTAERIALEFFNRLLFFLCDDSR